MRDMPNKLHSGSLQLIQIMLLKMKNRGYWDDSIGARRLASTCSVARTWEWLHAEKTAIAKSFKQTDISLPPTQDYEPQIRGLPALRYRGKLQKIR